MSRRSVWMRVSPKMRSTKPRNCVCPSPKRSDCPAVMQVESEVQLPTGDGSGFGAAGVGLGAGVGGTFWIGAGGVTASEAGEGAGDGDGDGLGDVSAVWAAAPFAIRRARKTTAATIERSDHIRRHPHHVEAAVDVQHFARDPAREAGDE